jgi:tRNA A-37 threonylcarbamoyl transferase component Bud32
LYFVNWQKDISIEELNGQKVVVKRNKSTKDFHEYLLISVYTLISILLVHPSSPPLVGDMTINNEGYNMRRNLGQLGIPTPRLISISDTALIEEYVEGGDLYKAFSEDNDTILLAFQAGALTGKLHKAGYVFIDNKSQNYLVKSHNLVVRTDLGFMQKKDSIFSRSMDIGSFLASVIDFESFQYGAIEKAFFDGYRSEMNQYFPYLYIILRNMLSLGFASNQAAMFRNMFVISTKAYESKEGT